MTDNLRRFIATLALTNSTHLQDHYISQLREDPGACLTREEHWLLHSIYTSNDQDERCWHCYKYLGDTMKVTELEAFAKERGKTFEEKPYRTRGNLLYDLYREMGQYNAGLWDSLSAAARSEWEDTANAYLTLERLWGM